MLFRDVGVEILEPQSQVEGQSLDGPPILREKPYIGLHVFAYAVGRRILLNRRWHGPEERIRHVAVLSTAVIALPLFDVDSGFECMRTGDVRRREALRLTVAVVGPAVSAAGRAERVRVVAAARQEIQCGNMVGEHTCLRDDRPVEEHERYAGFEEQPARWQRIPRGLIERIREETIPDERLRRRWRQVDGGRDVVLDVDKTAHLVLRRCLPGQSNGMRPETFIAVARAGRVRRVHGLALRLVPERTRLLVPVAPSSMSCEGPEPFAFDRAGPDSSLVTYDCAHVHS